MISHDDIADLIGIIGRWAPEEQAIFCLAVGLGLTAMRDDPPPSVQAEAMIHATANRLADLVAHIAHVRHESRAITAH